jgi:hypothetical protein
MPATELRQVQSGLEPFLVVCAVQRIADKHYTYFAQVIIPLRQFLWQYEVM